MKNGTDIGKKECPEKKCLEVMCSGERRQDADSVQRKNAQGALPIKVLIVARAGAVFEENRGNQKSGKHKKKINAGIAVGADIHDRAYWAVPVFGLKIGVQGVVKEDHESSQPTDAIEFADMFQVLGSGRRPVCEGRGYLCSGQAKSL